jgi:hypothetical protein
MRWSGKVAVGGLVALLAVGALGPPAGAGDTSEPKGPPVRISLGDVTVIEGNARHRAARVPVTLSEPLDHDVVVTWRTVPAELKPGVTATAGADYRAVAKKRTVIRAGRTGGQLAVRIYDDTVVDSPIEPFRVEIIETDDPELFVERQATVLIRDDESYEALADEPAPPGPWVGIGAVMAVEGDSARGQVVSVPITLSTPQTTDVFVRWATVGFGDAMPGDDFRPVARTTRIPAGHKKAWARITIYGDTMPEEDEEGVIVAVEEVTGGNGVVLLPQNTGGVLIVDDDVDTDDDGLSDLAERVYGTDLEIADSDGDGLNDGYEVYVLRTDPLSVDTDGDGLDDRYEVFESGTDPRSADTDGDGFDDLIEIKSGSDPLDPTSFPVPDPEP